MAARLEGGGRAAWSCLYALTVEVVYHTCWNGNFEEAISMCSTTALGRLAPVADALPSPIDSSRPRSDGRD